MEQDKFGLDFIVDKLTRSIENVITGDSFPTEISAIQTKDLKTSAKKKVGFSTGKLNLATKKGHL